MGLAKVEHKPSISKEDLRKLYDCGIVNTEDPKGLQNKVWFKMLVDDGEKTYKNYRKIVFLLGKIVLEEYMYAR